MQRIKTWRGRVKVNEKGDSHRAIGTHEITIMRTQTQETLFKEDADIINIKKRQLSGIHKYHPVFICSAASTQIWGWGALEAGKDLHE